LKNELGSRDKEIKRRKREGPMKRDYMGIEMN
jgi:hypothetical protein